MNPKCKFKSCGEFHYISEFLLEKQKAWENLETIKKLHKEKDRVFKKMEATDDSELLRKLAEQVEKIEFKLQEAWKFKKDKNLHRWFEVPKCLCPKMDNRDMLGTEYRVINESCPIHGKK